MTSRTIPMLLILMTAAGGGGGAGGCSGGGADGARPAATTATTAPSGLPTTTMQIGKRQFTIEIARNDADRTKGLMDRESLPKDHGMIFVFENERPLSFWMKNVPFPLDIVFLDRGGKIVDVKRMLPLDLRSVEGARPAQYAIELNAGAAAESGIRIGDVIVIPEEARKPE